MSIDPVQAVVVLGPRSGAREVAPARSASTVSPPVRETRVATAPQSVLEPRQVQVNASFGPANLIIYRILDKDTGDLIQQIPPQQLLEIARSVRELEQANPTQPSLDVRS